MVDEAAELALEVVFALLHVDDFPESLKRRVAKLTPRQREKVVAHLVHSLGRPDATIVGSAAQQGASAHDAALRRIIEADPVTGLHHAMTARDGQAMLKAAALSSTDPEFKRGFELANRRATKLLKDALDAADK